MDDVKERANQLRSAISAAAQKLQIDNLTMHLIDLQAQTQQPEFWNYNPDAKEIMKQISKLEKRIKPWQKLLKNVTDDIDLLQSADDTMRAEMEKSLQAIEDEFNAVKEQLKLTGPHDDYDAIITISAGAGGTDAQDWTQMLYRMYSRYIEKNKWKVKLVAESPGEEAGMKSLTMEVEGMYVYGKLKGEHGVHRLVRLSPFNSDNLRQTSFARVEVLPKIDAPNEVEIDEKDLKIDVFRSGGHGGQSVNTTDSAVRITHIPTNVVVTIQNERSQLQNRETAMTILRSRLAQLQSDQHAAHISELKGETEQAAWGNQIRSYVLHPYKQVKDLRTKYETSDVDSVLNGDLDAITDAYLEYSLGQHHPE